MPQVFRLWPPDYDSAGLNCFATGCVWTRLRLFSLTWVSISISLLRAKDYRSEREIHCWVDKNTLISILSMLKYWDIWTCTEAAYSGQKRALSVNILVIFFTESIACFSERSSWANLAIEHPCELLPSYYGILHRRTTTSHQLPPILCPQMKKVQGELDLLVLITRKCKETTLHIIYLPHGGDQVLDSAELQGFVLLKSRYCIIPLP